MHVDYDAYSIVSLLPPIINQFVGDPALPTGRRSIVRLKVGHLLAGQVPAMELDLVQRTQILNESGNSDLLERIALHGDVQHAQLFQRVQFGAAFGQPNGHVVLIVNVHLVGVCPRQNGVDVLGVRLCRVRVIDAIDGVVGGHAAERILAVPEIGDGPAHARVREQFNHVLQPVADPRNERQATERGVPEMLRLQQDVGGGRRRDANAAVLGVVGAALQQCELLGRIDQYSVGVQWQ